MKSAVLVLICALLPGCAVQLYGNQAAGAAATSSAVVASTVGSNAAIAASFGQPVSSAAPGGQLSVTGGGGNVAAVLLVGAVVAEFLNSLGGGPAGVKPLPPDTRISHTCSCYGWQPPAAEK